MISKSVDIYSQLATQMAVHIEKAINSFCFMKEISPEGISEDDYRKALNEVAVNLGLEITVEAESSTVISSPE